MLLLLLLLLLLLIWCLAMAAAAEEAAGAPAFGQPHRTDFPVPELYKMTTDFWDAFMYPENCLQAKSINSTLLAEDVQGRIDITRTFVGRELNTEYVRRIGRENMS